MPTPPSSPFPNSRKAWICWVNLCTWGMGLIWISIDIYHDKEQPLGYLLHWYYILLMACFFFQPFQLSSSPRLYNVLNNFHYFEIWEKGSAKKRKRSNKMRNMFIPITSQRFLGKRLSPMRSIIALSKNQLSRGRMAFGKCLLSWIQSNN